MIIRAMKHENVPDWFDFFDNRAFTDHTDWKGCYCTAFFFPRLKEYQSKSKVRKQYARWLIQNGSMKGYLAYENGKVVGWCNVNRKAVFPRLDDIAEEGESVLSITCFLVEKEYRRKGLAQKILDRIVKDAKAEGIRIIEAYPRKKAITEYGNFRGPYSLYEKNGFIAEAIKGVEVVRKYLQSAA